MKKNLPLYDANASIMPEIQGGDFRGFELRDFLDIVTALRELADHRSEVQPYLPAMRAHKPKL